MIGLIIEIFVLGYAAIAFEHTIKINKAASALNTGLLFLTLSLVVMFLVICCEKLIQDTYS